MFAAVYFPGDRKLEVINSKKVKSVNEKAQTNELKIKDKVLVAYKTATIDDAGRDKNNKQRLQRVHCLYKQRSEVTNFIESARDEIIKSIQNGTIEEYVKNYHDNVKSQKRKSKKTDKMQSLLEENEEEKLEEVEAGKKQTSPKKKKKTDSVSEEKSEEETSSKKKKKTNPVSDGISEEVEADKKETSPKKKKKTNPVLEDSPSKSTRSKKATTETQKLQAVEYFKKKKRMHEASSESTSNADSESTSNAEKTSDVKETNDSLQQNKPTNKQLSEFTEHLLHEQQPPFKPQLQDLQQPSFQNQQQFHHQQQPPFQQQFYNQHHPPFFQPFQNQQQFQQQFQNLNQFQQTPLMYQINQNQPKVQLQHQMTHAQQQVQGPPQQTQTNIQSEMQQELHEHQPMKSLQQPENIQQQKTEQHIFRSTNSTVDHTVTQTKEGSFSNSLSEEGLESTAAALHGGFETLYGSSTTCNCDKYRQKIRTLEGEMEELKNENDTLRESSGMNILADLKKIIRTYDSDSHESESIISSFSEFTPIMTSPSSTCNSTSQIPYRSSTPARSKTYSRASSPASASDHIDYLNPDETLDGYAMFFEPGENKVKLVDSADLYIDAIKLKAIRNSSKGNASRIVRELLSYYFSNNVLATHSATGRKSPKPALPEAISQPIRVYCAVNYKMTAHTVNNIINRKCLDVKRK